MPLGHRLQPFNEGARHPKNGMKPKEAERADQQARHSPKGVEEIRIILLIVMGRMGQVGGKAQVGIRMTDRASLHNIGGIDSGGRVLSGHDTMRAMTVGTFSRPLTAFQHRSTTMVGFEVGLRMMLMAVTALLGDNQPEVLGMNLADGVVCVTIDTNRQFFIGFRHQRAMNRFFEFVDNADVALIAGVDDIISIDA